MSQVSVTPAMLTTAAAEVAAIAGSLNAGYLMTAPAALGVVPAAADEVSAAIAHLFSAQAQDFHALSRQAAAYHDAFVQTLSTGAATYAGAEAINASLLQAVDVVVRQMTMAVLDALIGYAAWAQLWVDAVPGPLQPYVYLPVLLAFLSDLAIAAFGATIATAIRLIPG